MPTQSNEHPSLNRGSSNLEALFPSVGPHRPRRGAFFLIHTKTLHRLALNLLSNALDTTSSQDSNNQSLLLKTETRSRLDGSSSVLCIMSQSTASQVFLEHLQHPSSSRPGSVKPGKWVSSSLSKLSWLLCLNEKFTVLHCASFLERLLH